MKKILKRIPVVLLVLLAFLAVGCSNIALAPAASGITGKVTVQIPSIPAVSASVSQALSGASPGSRAFMFMNKYLLRIWDETTYSYLDDLWFTPSVNGPGNGSYVDVNLAYGHSYEFVVYGYNDQSDLDYPTVKGSISGMYVDANHHSVMINLLPYSPEYMDLSSGELYSNILQAQIEVVAGGKVNFLKLGGEKWYSIYPDTNVTSITLKPSGGVIYAALYDSKGRQLTAGVSPAFSDPSSTELSVTLESGLTSYDYAYIGVITVTEGVPLEDTVAVTLNKSILEDDAYEDNDSSREAQYLGFGSGIYVQDLKAYDEDWFEFWANANTTYTVTVKDTDAGFVGGYDGEVSVEGDNGTVAELSSYVDKDTTVPKEAFEFSFNIVQSGYYRVKVGLQHTDPDLKFSTVGGSYSLSISSP